VIPGFYRGSPFVQARLAGIFRFIRDVITKILLKQPADIVWIRITKHGGKHPKQHLILAHDHLANLTDDLLRLIQHNRLFGLHSSISFVYIIFPVLYHSFPKSATKSYNPVYSFADKNAHLISEVGRVDTLQVAVFG